MFRSGGRRCAGGRGCRAVGRVGELVAQPRDVGAHDLGIGVGAPGPDPAQQGLAGQDPAGVLGQHAQEFVRGRRQLHRAPGPGDPPLVVVEGEGPERERDGRRPPAQDRPDRRRVTSLSLVRYRRNDDSVPTAYGHREVVVKGFVDEVVIVCGSEEIARHRRSYEREALIFEPRHDLALLERKIGALDQAAPLAGWTLPEAFGRLRRLVEARLGQAGTREYVQVLRRLEDFRLAHVSGAIQDALRLGAIGFAAVKHLVLCRLEHRPPRLDLAQYPHLPAPRVTTTAAADDLALVGAGAE